MRNNRLATRIFIKGSRNLLALAVSFSAFACRHSGDDYADRAEVKFAQGGPGRFHGHEVMIYIGAEMASENPEVGAGFYDTASMDRSRDDYRNPLIWGSLAADFPFRNEEILNVVDFVDNRYCYFFNFDVNDAAQKTACHDMPYAPSFQDIHFLRTWQGSEANIQLDSAEKTCIGAQNRILDATVEGLMARDYSFKSKEHFFRDYWAGVAVHTVQDSFSEAHTKRSGSDWRKIEDICFYNKQYEGDGHTCQHDTPFDGRDIIWKDGLPYNLSKDAYFDLKPAAQFATQATKAYLISYARLVKAAIKDNVITSDKLKKMVAIEMASFFTDASRGEGFGSLDCSTLKVAPPS